MSVCAGWNLAYRIGPSNAWHSDLPWDSRSKMRPNEDVHVRG
jgi:hypothetical protein